MDLGWVESLLPLGPSPIGNCGEVSTLHESTRGFNGSGSPQGLALSRLEYAPREFPGSTLPGTGRAAHRTGRIPPHPTCSGSVPLRPSCDVSRGHLFPADRSLRE